MISRSSLLSPLKIGLCSPSYYHLRSWLHLWMHFVCLLHWFHAPLLVIRQWFCEPLALKLPVVKKRLKGLGKQYVDGTEAKEVIQGMELGEMILERHKGRNK